jgi:hypothetical protein
VGEIERFPQRQNGKSAYSGGFSLPAIGSLQAIDRNDKVGPLEHLDKPLKDALVIVRAGLQVFFKDALRVANRLKRQLLIGHFCHLGRRLSAYLTKLFTNWFPSVRRTLEQAHDAKAISSQEGRR